MLTIIVFRFNSYNKDTYQHLDETSSLDSFLVGSSEEDDDPVHWEKLEQQFEEDSDDDCFNHLAKRSKQHNFSTSTSSSDKDRHNLRDELQPKFQADRLTISSDEEETTDASSGKQDKCAVLQYSG